MSAWRPVAGFEGLYEVSDGGEVRSIERLVARGNGQLRVPARVLRQAKIQDGRMKVSLWSNGVGVNAKVHRLVAIAFLGGPFDGKEVRHLDGDPSNNSIENLMRGTHSENEMDKIRHGTHFHASKTHCKNGHEFTAENTRQTAKQRVCRTCRKRASLAWWHRKRLEDVK